jgi:hypothetical protein
MAKINESPQSRAFNVTIMAEKKTSRPAQPANRVIIVLLTQYYNQITIIKCFKWFSVNSLQLREILRYTGIEQASKSLCGLLDRLARLHAPDRADGSAMAAAIFLPGSQ